MYICQCHHELANQHKDNKKPLESLGTWTCKVTGKKCKVSRVK